MGGPDLHEPGPGRLVEDQHPLGYVAAAAAAQAADDPARAGELLDRAQRLQERFPTYYGGAWVALGHAMLRTSALGGCPTG
jgi:endoglucanase